MRNRLDETSAGSLQSRLNAFEEKLIIKRLGQEFHGTGSHRSQPYFFVAMCRNEDGWDGAILSVQSGLQIQS
jgi:hypothetical protein